MARVSEPAESAECRVLPAAPGDAAAMATLHARCFAMPWSETGIERLLEDEAILALKAASTGAGHLAGFVIARAAAGEAEILTLAVAPDHRRQGLGRALVRSAAARLAAMGACRLFLEVAAGNSAAAALYGDLGFARIGRRKRYYRRDGEEPEDAVCLALRLGDR